MPASLDGAANLKKGRSELSARSYRLFCKLSRFDGVDLQRDVVVVGTGLRKGGGGNPQGRVWRAGPHVAKLLRFVIKTPDRPNAFGDGFAEARGYNVIQALVAGGQNDQVGAQRRAIPELQSIGRKMLDVGRLDQTNLLIRDQLGTSDVEIIAPAPRPELEGPASAVFAEFQPEADFLEALQQRRVQFLHLIGDQLVRRLDDRDLNPRVQDVANVDRRRLAEIGMVVQLPAGV